MKNKKAIAATFLAMMVVSVQALPVYATSFAPPESGQMLEYRTISPRWTSTTLVAPSISNSGRSISASIIISPKLSSAKSSGTLYLEQYVGGRWKTAKSWSINKSGTVDITKSYTGKSNVKYRVKVVVTTGSDNITAYSNEITL